MPHEHYEEDPYEGGGCGGGPDPDDPEDPIYGDGGRLDMRGLNAYERPTLFEAVYAIIRDLDAKDGGQLLERFLDGPQVQIDATLVRIDMLRDTDLPATCQSVLLQFLKDHVGFTQDLRSITDRLDEAALRKLIQSAMTLWREKGTAAGIISMIRLLSGRSPMFMDWFDFRFILGESLIGEEQKGVDSWIIGGNLTDYDEYFSNLRIMDDGTLDSYLLVGLLDLVRPNSERLEIVLLDFLDMFSDSETPDRWTKYGTGDAAIITSGDWMEIPPATLMSAVAPIVQHNDYEDWIHIHKFKLATAGNKHYAMWITDYEVTSPRLVGYILEAVDSGEAYNLKLRRIGRGVSDVTDVYTSGGIVLSPGVEHKLRVHTTVREADDEIDIKIWIEDVLQIDIIDTTPGAVGTTTFLEKDMMAGWIYPIPIYYEDPTQCQILALGSDESNSGNNSVDNVESWRMPLRYALLSPSGVAASEGFYDEDE